MAGMGFRVRREGGLGVRLLVGVLAAFLVVVPFTLLLMLVDTKWGPLRRLDEGTTRSMNTYVLHHRVLVEPLRLSSYVLHAWVFRGLVLLLAGWLLRRGARRLAVWAVVTVVTAAVLDAAVKVLVDRPRPKLQAPIAHFSSGSFPSGHALTAAMGSLMIVLILLPVLGRVARIAAWTLAAVLTLVAGLCRVALGVHYVSDVLAGWILGVAIVLATATAFETWRREEGRPTTHLADKGLEPEAAPQISPTGDPADAPDRT